MIERRPDESSSPARILIVDDNRDWVESTVLLLEHSFGYQVASALDFEGARAKALDFQPDVALVDLHLPGHSGVELASLLRGLPCAPALLAVTGDARFEREAQQAGFVDCLLKPVDRSDFARAIDRALARSGPGPRRAPSPALRRDGAA